MLSLKRMMSWSFAQVCSTTQLLVPILTAHGEDCDEQAEHFEAVSEYSQTDCHRSRCTLWGHCTIPRSGMWEWLWSIFLTCRLERKWEGPSWIHSLSSWLLLTFPGGHGKSFLTFLLFSFSVITKQHFLPHEEILRAKPWKTMGTITLEQQRIQVVEKIFAFHMLELKTK